MNEYKKTLNELFAEGKRLEADILEQLNDWKYEQV